VPSGDPAMLEAAIDRAIQMAGQRFADPVTSRRPQRRSAPRPILARSGDTRMAGGRSIAADGRSVGAAYVAAGSGVIVLAVLPTNRLGTRSPGANWWVGRPLCPSL
jgi:hypothetical protein